MKGSRQTAQAQGGGAPRLRACDRMRLGEWRGGGPYGGARQQ
jgi:hypothetical protein